jgi:hypothetical protein
MSVGVPWWPKVSLHFFENQGNNLLIAKGVVILDMEHLWMSHLVNIILWNMTHFFFFIFYASLLTVWRLNNSNHALIFVGFFFSNELLTTLVSRGCLLILGTWSYLRICRRFGCPTLDFVIAFWINSLLDYGYVLHIVNFAILYRIFTLSILWSSVQISAASSSSIICFSLPKHSIHKEYNSIQNSVYTILNCFDLLIIENCMFANWSIDYISINSLIGKN